MEEFFKLVPARQFFANYAPTVKRYYHKMRGIDGNKQPLTFTHDDREAMKQGLKKLSIDLKTVKF
jgi:hypothetical protein